MLKSFFHKKVLYKDIEEYTRWKGRRYSSSANSDKTYLLHLAKKTPAEDVSEITVDDVMSLRKELIDRSSLYSAKEAVKAVKCLIRYFRARRMYVVDERIFRM